MDICHNILSDQTPPLKDCSEVYRMGVKAPGWYNLDPSGNLNNNDDEFYCEDGWTYILRREPKLQELRYSVGTKRTFSFICQYYRPV